MNPEKEQKYIDDILGGSLPDQETFTKEEVFCISKVILSWASLQINHVIEEHFHDDIPNLVAVCGYKTIEEGIEDTEQALKDELFGLRDYISEWLSIN